MDCHVTNWGKQPIKLKTDVASMGKLGYDVDVSHMGENDIEFVQSAVNNYNGFKDVVLHGNQFRLSSPYKNPYASFLYVDKDRSKAIMFNYLTSNRFMERYSKRPIKLKGLAPDKRYKIKELNLYPGTETVMDESEIYTGDFLMKVGINPEIDVKRTSVVLSVSEVK